MDFHKAGVQEGLASPLLPWLALGLPHDSLAAAEVNGAQVQLCDLGDLGGPIQPSAVLKSAAGLSHCWRGLSLGCGLGEGSRRSNWPLSANKAFSLEKSADHRTNLFCTAKPHLFFSA